MYNKILTSVACAFGAVLSAFLFFKEIIEDSLYAESFKSSVTEDLLYSPPETLIYVCSVILFFIITALSAFLNKKTLSLVFKFLSLFVFLLSLFAIFTVDMPGEGLEIFLAFPVVIAVFVIETVLFIVTLVKNKADNNGRISYTAFNTVLLLFTFFIKFMCWDLSLSVLSVMCVITYFCYLFNSDEAVKNKTKYILYSYFSILICSTITFINIYGFYYR